MKETSSTLAITTKTQEIVDESPFVAKPTAVSVPTRNPASMSNTRYVLCVISCLALWSSGTVAFAQINHSHHEHHADHYRHWQRPDAGGSCCNARTTKDGYEEGDCEPTKAEIRDGIWFAWLREQNRWVQIPDIRIINERNPSPEDAHLCWAG